MSELRAPVQKYAIPIGAVITAAVFVFGAYLPHSRRYSALRERSSSMTQQLLERADRLERIRHSDVAGSQLDRVALDVVMPEAVQMGEFLETIDRLAEREGLTDRSVVPEETVDGTEVSWLPIRMDFRGSYRAVHAFLERVENLPRLARIQRLTLERSSEENDETLMSSLVMHVYYRRS